MIALEGRVIRLNYVLNVLPVFFLYFLKRLVKVWKKLVKIHMRFLWEDVKYDSKIS